MDECISELICLHKIYDRNKYLNKHSITGKYGKVNQSTSSTKKPIVYTSDKLKCTRDNVYHDECYRILSGQKCKSIRSLRINKKRNRGSKAGLKPKLQSHVGWSI